MQIQIMGRSPHWFQYVDPIGIVSSGGNIKELFQARFNAALTEHTPAMVVDPVVASGTAGFRFRIGRVASLDIVGITPSGILRSCSTYGMEEEASPKENGTACYVAKHAVRYRLPFPVMDDSIEYDIFYVERLDAPTTMCTWVIRCDGVVLNIESFQPICIVKDVVILDA